METSKALKKFWDSVEKRISDQVVENQGLLKKFATLALGFRAAFRSQIDDGHVLSEKASDLWDQGVNDIAIPNSEFEGIVKDASEAVSDILTDPGSFDTLKQLILEAKEVMEENETVAG